MGTSSAGGVRPSSAALENLTARVHTYESFGRAVISHVLSESSKGTALKDGVPAQFVVKPMTNPTHGGEPFCVTIAVMFENTAHYIMVCSPITIA